MKTRSPLPFLALRVSSLAASLMLCASVSFAAQSTQPQTIEDIIATQLLYQSPSSINTGTEANAGETTAQDTIDSIYNTGAVATVAAAAQANDPRTLAATPPPSLLNSPCGLALDKSGNLYVADSTANAIWKITGDSKATLLAGDPAQPAGATNAKGTAARFNFPINLAIRSGTLYVADTGNNTIRAISPDGTVRTLAGTPDFTGTNYCEGTGAGAIFSAPAGIALDNKGQLYTTDAGNGYIRKITPAGATTWLSGAQLPDNSYGGSITYGATVTMANYAITGTTNYTISGAGELILFNLDAVTNLTATGVLNINGSALTGGGAIFGTVSQDNSTITLANSSTLALNGSLLTSGSALILNNGTFGNGLGGLSLSGGVITTNPGIFITDTTPILTPTDTTTLATPNAFPAAAAMLAPDPHVLAATTITLAQILANAPTYTPDQYYFSSLGGMTLSPDGDYLYLAANGVDICAIKIADGSVAALDTEIFGDAGTYSNPLRPRFASNLRFDAQGNLYIADTGNSRILKVAAADGTVTSIAGGGTPDSDGNYQAGYQDGPAATALFSQPSDIAIDAAGNIYVADTGNGLIRKIDTKNNVTTLTLQETAPDTGNNGTNNTGNTDSGGGGGGGGALSAWYLLALAALGVTRLRRR